MQKMSPMRTNKRGQISLGQLPMIFQIFASIGLTAGITLILLSEFMSSVPDDDNNPNSTGQGVQGVNNTITGVNVMTANLDLLGLIIILGTVFFVAAAFLGFNRRQ